MQSVYCCVCWTKKNLAKCEDLKLHTQKSSQMAVSSNLNPQSCSKETHVTLRDETAGMHAERTPAELPCEEFEGGGDKKKTFNMLPFITHCSL